MKSLGTTYKCGQFRSKFKGSQGAILSVCVRTVLRFSIASMKYLFLVI